MGDKQVGATKALASFCSSLSYEQLPPEVVDKDYWGDRNWEIADVAAEEFKKKYGALAIPVESLEEAHELEHFGKKGVVTSATARKLLKSSVGSIATAREEIRKADSRVWQLDELNDLETARLRFAVELLEPYVGKIKHRVVEFHDKATMGTYVDGMISIARSTLGCKWRTLQVVIHECSHLYGGDGEMSHVGKIEEMWMSVVRRIVEGGGE